MSSPRNYRIWARNVQPEPPATLDPLTARERRRLSQAAKAARLQAEMDYVGRACVWTPSQADAVPAVHRILDLARYNVRGAQQSLYALGPSGTGKSTLMDHLAHALHREYVAAAEIDEAGQPVIGCEDGTADYVPVVWIDLISDSRQRGVAHQLVTYFRRFVPTNEPGAKTLGRGIDLAIQHGTKVVFLDECDNLATQRADRRLLDNMVKNLNTALGRHGIAFVYLGLPDPQGRGNLEDDPQLRNRLVRHPFTFMDLDLKALQVGPEHLQWRDHLLQWEEVLSLVLPDLHRGDLASRLARLIWKRTRGSIGGLSALLKGVAFAALSDTSGRSPLTITETALRTLPLPVEFTQAGT